MRRRYVIKDYDGINICDIFNNADRRRYKKWTDKLEEFLCVYNKVETIILFYVYNKGYGRIRIISILRKYGVTQYAYRKFMQAMRTTDRYNILRAHNIQEIG